MTDRATALARAASPDHAASAVDKPWQSRDPDVLAAWWHEVDPTYGTTRREPPVQRTAEATEADAIYSDPFYRALPAHLQKRVLEIGGNMRALKALRAAGREAEAARLRAAIEADIAELTKQYEALQRERAQSAAAPDRLTRIRTAWMAFRTSSGIDQMVEFRRLELALGEPITAMRTAGDCVHVCNHLLPADVQLTIAQAERDVVGYAVPIAAEIPVLMFLPPPGKDQDARGS